MGDLFVIFLFKNRASGVDDVAARLEKGESLFKDVALLSDEPLEHGGIKAVFHVGVAPQRSAPCAGDIDEDPVHLFFELLLLFLLRVEKELPILNSSAGQSLFRFIEDPFSDIVEIDLPSPFCFRGKSEGFPARSGTPVQNGIAALRI